MATTDVNFSGGVAESQNTWDVTITSSVAGDLMVVTIDDGATVRTLGYVVMTGTETDDAATLTASIEEWVNVGWSATNPGAPSAVTRIFPPTGLGATANAYVIAVAFQTGATSTATVNGVGGIGAETGVNETAATGTVTITVAGGEGELVAVEVDNGAFVAVIGEYKTLTGDTVSDIAGGLKDSINENTIYTGYSATNLLGVLTITPDAGYGNITYDITSVISTPVQIGATEVNFTAGTASIGAYVQAEVTTEGQEGEILVALIDNGSTVDVLGEYKVQAADTVSDIALGLIGSIGDNTVNHGYSATNLLGVITITAPPSLGTTPSVSSYSLSIDTYGQDQIDASKTNFSAAGVDLIGDQDSGDMSAANATSLAVLGTVYDLWSDPDYYPIHVAWTTIYPTKTIPRAVHLLGGYNLTTSDTYYGFVLRVVLMIFTLQTIENYVNVFKKIIDDDNTANNVTTLTTGQDLECLMLGDGELWREKYITGNKQLQII
jgi:hypothetical protein